MTATLMEVLEESGASILLADRRFSTEVRDIGNASIRKIFSALGLAWRVHRLAGEADVCVFFVTNRTGSFLVDCLLSVILRRRSVAVISYVHTNGFRHLAGRSKHWARAVRLLFRRNESVVCLGESLHEDVLPFLSGSTRISAIPNTAPVPLDPSSMHADDRVLYFSNLIPEKGIEEFLEVARELQQPSSARFIAAGSPSSEAQLMELRERACSNTAIMGGVYGGAKEDLFASASMLVFPSRYRFEAQPLTILEAMSGGIPVVAYDVGGISDLVQDEVNGVLVPAGDTAGLINAVRRLLEHPELRATMSANARSIYDAKFSRGAFRTAWENEMSAIDA